MYCHFILMLKAYPSFQHIIHRIVGEFYVLHASDPVHSFGPFSDRNFGFCQLSRQHAKGVDRRKCRLKGPFQVRGIKMHLKCKVFRSYYQHYPSAPLMHPNNGGAILSERLFLFLHTCPLTRYS